MEKPVGAEGVLKLELVDGKLKISAAYDGKGADAALSVAVDSDYFVDKLAALIPGDSSVEQIALGAIKLALKSVKI